MMMITYFDDLPSVKIIVDAKFLILTILAGQPFIGVASASRQNFGTGPALAFSPGFAATALLIPLTAASPH